MGNYRGSFKYILVVVILHIIGFIGLYISLPQHPFLFGMGVLAYTLGLRHAFDIDHIAAIDTTVRKLVEQKKNPTGVGFFFSLGHSTVVFLLAIFTSFSVKFVKNNLPQMQDIGGLIGTVVSGTFLVIMGVINLVILLNIIGVFKKMRKKNYKESELEVLLNSRGFLTPLIQPLFKFINKSWHVYPIGFLFGLGFDTASEIALLTLSAGAAQHNLSFVSILSLPVLFAAGMSLMDTLDGAFMTSSYNWAFDKPIRKVYYNITVTTLSVIAAIFVGLLELTQIIGEKLHVQNNWFKIIDKLDLGDMGYILVIMFILVWSIAYFIWKYFNIEEKWSMHI
ncbi:HoxN/HupN/NixA family nickel/cobalt transporter [Priestia megaterium]|uniref:HoxN/HupN/NixA family nickel/cobalt transporter n=1 Tax=Priestia megaterium TaxID=1404 RepID=UPI001B3A04B8|nr:HoxN/HupN/NixA family nickel/cobalt transporter [Priestia megaterium]MBQ4870377.1 HoxN/HupN/NixA family nickel/cobalt transporter [Priestia megaterium]